MSAKRPSQNQEVGVVLSDIAELVGEAEEKNGAWPELDGLSFSSVPIEHSNFTERITLWTMVGLLGAVTIYGIATGDQRILAGVLAIAAGTLLRLTRLTTDKNRSGEIANDPRAKGPPKKRRK